MVRILIADHIGTRVLGILRENLKEHIINYAYDPRASIDFGTELANAEILVVGNATRVTEDFIMALAPKVKIIAKAGNGMENMELSKEFCRANGIYLIDAPEAKLDAVAQSALFKIGDLLRCGPKMHNGIIAGKWHKEIGRELSPEITAGIVGYNRVGQRVARFLQIFGVKLVIFDPFNNINGIRNATKVEELSELLRASDVVSLHCNVTEENTGMINTHTISQMKQGAILLNFAGARLVDMGALCDALQNGKLGGVHLDVFDNEPRNSKAEFNAGAIKDLASRYNVSFTCHSAGKTKDSQIRIAYELVKKIRTALDAIAISRDAQKLNAPNRTGHPPLPKGLATKSG